ncbi:hypothetical protein PybrP1_010652 [[Pythium] brassicae (nom. inval.)]|nr:hypothetical protein PybrP1_010652 [[Pythium] brassicae (nom. inval.)]
MLNLHAGTACDESVGAGDTDADDSARARDWPSFQQIDDQIALSVQHHSKQDAVRTVDHLQRVMALLRELKASGGGGSKSALAKTVGTRELLVHLILSDVHFADGRGTLAVREAKAALSICWKLAKKFATAGPRDDVARFTLPDEIVAHAVAGGDGSRAVSLIFFKALEFSSWDILHAAKLVLCRIGTLYSWMGQPQRSRLYFTEAMQLVGGLHLRFFQRSPFFEFARLQLHASHPAQAKAALQALWLSHSEWSRVIRADSESATAVAAAGDHQCVLSDLALIEQQCNEGIQRGDLELAEGDAKSALKTYLSALESLKSSFGRDPLPSTGLRAAQSRCYRKLLHLKATHANLSAEAEVDKLVLIAKTLERCVRRCEDHVERFKGMLELGCFNLSLLRTLPSRSIMTINETTAFLEDAYALGDRLGLSHLSKQVRGSLGVAYLLAAEAPASSAVRGGKDHHRFLSWASATLLANASVVERRDDERSPDDLDAADRELEQSLEHLSSQLKRSSRVAPRAQLEQLVASVKAQVRKLPPSWVVVSVAVSASCELVLSRITSDGSDPLSFCLEGVDWKRTMDEVEAVIRASRESLVGNSVDATGAWSTDQKKQWWSKRNELDDRLRSAVAGLQAELGFWKCLLVRDSAVASRSIHRCWSVLASSAAEPQSPDTKYRALLAAMAGQHRYLSDAELLNGIEFLAAKLNARLSQVDAARVLKIVREEAASSVLCHKDEEADDDRTASPLLALTSDAINTMRVSELKQVLIAAGLSADGLKKTLVERLAAARDAALAHQAPSRVSLDDDEQPGSTILVLDQRLQEFPWEGLDILGGCESVTRMPSLELILASVRAVHARTKAASGRSRADQLSIRRERISFLLNAAGDLKGTEQHMAPVFEIGRTKFGWRGTMGRVPDEAEMRGYLLESDMFIYCGHGSGEKYLHRSKIADLKPLGCSAALLFGCSSGRLESEGVFGPDGAVLSYLRAGSAAVLAMLWDVTDRDIDQLSVAVLRTWLLGDMDDASGSSRRAPLAGVLREARRVCKLKFLNGHAAVCYGLPLYLAA